MLPVHVFDHVIDQVATALGQVGPEQGGALLGLRGRDVLTAFVHDAHAHVTRVEYSNTSWLLEEITRREGAGPERFKGIVHSHPRGMPYPSRQDHREYGRALEAVPELGRYIAPIVTHDADTPLEQHELLHGGARVSFYSASRTARGVRLEPLRPVVVPLAEALRRAGFAWSPESPRTQVVSGVAGVGVRLPAAAEDELTRHLFVTPDFPVVAPLLLEEPGHGGEPPTRQLAWDHRVPALDRLGHALRNAGTSRTRPSTRSSGRAVQPRSEEPGGTDSCPPPPPHEVGVPDRPRNAAPAPHQSSMPEVPEGPLRTVAVEQGGGALCRLATWLGFGRGAAARRGLSARTHGLLSPDLAQAHVLLVGVGSVGSYLADVLVRSGVGALTLVDPDVVEPANVGRALFGVEDIGASKVKATARRLRAVNNRLKVTVRRRQLSARDSLALHRLVTDADLVIAATDDNQAQQLLNHVSYFVGRPAVFVGLYEGAAGGEVVFTTPGSPCWACATGGVREVLGELGHQPRTDYGTGRTHAVPGLLPDIQHTAAAAAKIALALLHDPAADERIAGFLTMPRREGLSMVQFAMEPDHWFFPAVLGQAPGQHAFQSVWLRTGGRPECAVCGLPALRTDPRDYQAERDEAAVTRAQQAAYAKRRRVGSTPP
ncbi:ThiF family adenylyltransferase [Streptomyces alkaliterrae]|uniref:ThiF family adenylyltransferase n=1 Tax=Streptomyces alkaliterrae TaxID=2213162 RepID=A0A7W3WU53_9ACTN|nr:ThiF family adenylyltransferase [Streptomyces alkaliterrae]MBB1258563.1 ThiF family adenylyltransferase [Streptomyces alkaliterrae]